MVEDGSVSRFHSQAQTAEDLLKERTIGLVQLSDFRKRQAEAIEDAERSHTPLTSGATTPNSRDPETEPTFKKKKKKLGKSVRKAGGLSFAEEEEVGKPTRNFSPKPGNSKGEDGNPATNSVSEEPWTTNKRVKPNTTLGFKPKAMTKSVLAREAQMKEHLRQEYVRLQEAVKQTEMAIPFCFFDGRNAPGGICRVKKGDQVWIFLERARKLGADMAGKGDTSKKDWARISVDDLILVRGDLIIPHHYEFHYFILNRTQGYHGVLFEYSSEPTQATPSALLVQNPSDATEDERQSEGGLMNSKTSAKFIT